MQNMEVHGKDLGRQKGNIQTFPFSVVNWPAGLFSTGMLLLPSASTDDTVLNLLIRLLKPLLSIPDTSLVPPTSLIELWPVLTNPQLATRK